MFIVLYHYKNKKAGITSPAFCRKKMTSVKSIQDKNNRLFEIKKYLIDTNRDKAALLHFWPAQDH